jgi:hypothetical protein
MSLPKSPLAIPASAKAITGASYRIDSRAFYIKI